MNWQLDTEKLMIHGLHSRKTGAQPVLGIHQSSNLDLDSILKTVKNLEEQGCVRLEDYSQDMIKWLGRIKDVDRGAYDYMCEQSKADCFNVILCEKLRNAKRVVAYETTKEQDEMLQGLDDWFRVGHIWAEKNVTKNIT